MLVLVFSVSGRRPADRFLFPVAKKRNTDTGTEHAYFVIWNFLFVTICVTLSLKISCGFRILKPSWIRSLKQRPLMIFLFANGRVEKVRCRSRKGFFIVDH